MEKNLRDECQFCPAYENCTLEIGQCVKCGRRCLECNMYTSSLSNSWYCPTCWEEVPNDED